MILSRIFNFSLGFFLILSAIAYFIIDTRPEEEQALEALNKGKYLKVLSLLHDQRFLEEEDYALLALATAGLEKEINSLDSESSQISEAEDLKNDYNINYKKHRYSDRLCIHLDDPYFPSLKRHAYHYQNVLLAKAEASYFCNHPDKNSEFLNRILLEDPSNFIEKTSSILKNLFQVSLNPIGELERKFLREVLHYLSDQEKSLFYQNIYKIVGTRVNFRSGPGRENNVIDQLEEGEEVYCFDQDSVEEIIGETKGNWMHCFSSTLFQSGWIFSGQMERLPADPKILQTGRERFASLEFFTRVDFQTWNPKFPPLNYHGDYIPTEKIVKRGEVGFLLHRSDNGKMSLICRKFSKRKNYFELYYEILNSELPIPLIELHVVQGGRSIPAFLISAEKDSILVNGARFMIDNPRPRETLALKIATNMDDSISGTLIHKNHGVLEEIQSMPVDESILKRREYSWEVCIPQGTQRTNDEALLYGYRIGRE